MPEQKNQYWNAIFHKVVPDDNSGMIVEFRMGDCLAHICSVFLNRLNEKVIYVAELIKRKI